MPKPQFFQPEHLAAFAAIPFEPQPPYGKAPTRWASMMQITGSPELPTFDKLPDKQLTRPEVRKQCLAPFPVLHGYIVAMAWGDQGAGPGGTKHALTAWQSRGLIAELLTELRKGKLTRRDAYDLFATNPVTGLGPSYYSKLLYFFRSGKSTQPVDRYIMDKPTAKSINLLAGEQIVRLNKDGNVEASNTGENYDAFCREVDRLAQILNARHGATPPRSGEDVEQMLFSLGSIKKQPPRAWRQYLDAKWDKGRPTLPYDRERVVTRAAAS